MQPGHGPGCAAGPMTENDKLYGGAARECFTLRDPEASADGPRPDGRSCFNFRRPAGTPRRSAADPTRIYLRARLIIQAASDPHLHWIAGKGTGMGGPGGAGTLLTSGNMKLQFL